MLDSQPRRVQIKFMSRLVKTYDKWTGYDLEFPGWPAIPGKSTYGAIGTVRWLLIDRCPMCKSTITKEDLPQSVFATKAARDMVSDAISTHLHHCAVCGWWSVREHGGDLQVPSAKYDFDRLISSILEEWDVSSKSAPVDLLMTFLNHRKMHFREVHPFAFEKIIADCLKVEFGPCEVRHVGSSGGKGDEGIDAFVVKDGVVGLAKSSAEPTTARKASMSFEC
jgi:hypothetical protein